jgi:hypothetical protein
VVWRHQALAEAVAKHFGDGAFDALTGPLPANTLLLPNTEPNKGWVGTMDRRP